MSRYAVEVKEILRRTILVEAEDADEALEKIKEAYREELIILDSGDYDDTDIGLSPYFGNETGEVFENEDVGAYERLEDITE